MKYTNIQLICGNDIEGRQWLAGYLYDTQYYCL
jgi:hypothetical protein